MKYKDTFPGDIFRYWWLNKEYKCMRLYDGKAVLLDSKLRGLVIDINPEDTIVFLNSVVNWNEKFDLKGVNHETVS